MNDDDKRPWDENNPFNQFNNFEEFIEHFKEFINTPFAQSLMKQIFENFRHISKSSNLPNDFDFNQFVKKMMERQGFEVSSFSPRTSRKSDKKEFEPTYSVHDEGDQVRVIVDLPGFDREGITVQIKEREVEIQAESEGKKANQVIGLQEKVNPNRLDSRWNNGVLELLLEKL